MLGVPFLDESEEAELASEIRKEKAFVSKKLEEIQFFQSPPQETYGLNRELNSLLHHNKTKLEKLEELKRVCKSLTSKKKNYSAANESVFKKRNEEVTSELQEIQEKLTQAQIQTEELQAMKKKTKETLEIYKVRNNKLENTHQKILKNHRSALRERNSALNSEILANNKLVKFKEDSSKAIKKLSNRLKHMQGLKKQLQHKTENLFERIGQISISARKQKLENSKKLETAKHKKDKLLLQKQEAQETQQKLQEYKKGFSALFEKSGVSESFEEANLARVIATYKDLVTYDRSLSNKYIYLSTTQHHKLEEYQRALQELKRILASYNLVPDKPSKPILELERDISSLKPNVKASSTENLAVTFYSDLVNLVGKLIMQFETLKKNSVSLQLSNCINELQETLHKKAISQPSQNQKTTFNTEFVTKTPEKDPKFSLGYQEVFSNYFQNQVDSETFNSILSESQLSYFFIPVETIKTYLESTPEPLKSVSSLFSLGHCALKSSLKEICTSLGFSLSSISRENSNPHQKSLSSTSVCYRRPAWHFRNPTQVTQKYQLKDLDLKKVLPTLYPKNSDRPKTVRTRRTLSQRTNQVKDNFQETTKTSREVESANSKRGSSTNRGSSRTCSSSDSYPWSRRSIQQSIAVKIYKQQLTDRRARASMES